MSPNAAIEVMLVDDSAVARGLMARGLQKHGDIRVIAMAGNGQDALVMLERVRPQVIVLDIEMPTMSGIEALPRILAQSPGVVVIMASALTRRHAAMSLRALELGAADYVPKPDAQSGQDALPKFLDELGAKIKALAHARGRSAPPTTEARAIPLALKLFKPAAIAIGASTGGPPALNQVCARLRGRAKTPIFITQHMPPTFTAMLAEQLGKVSGAAAFEGAHGMVVEPGAIYVAPGGKHMLAERRAGRVVLALSDAPPEHFCRPAVDPMFRSLADVYGASLLAIVLTGMGRDGADGAVAVADRGGRVIAQDEASSVVYGMPGAVFKTGRASAELPLDDIAALVASAATERAL